MYIFDVYERKNNNEDYIKSDGDWLFPLNFSSMLDKRLDEAYINVINSTRDVYIPTTQIKIEITEKETSYKKTLYYVVSNCKSRQYPVNSNTYMHKLFVIESIKLLEGIVCQSLTFTNSKFIEAQSIEVMPNNGVAYLPNAVINDYIIKSPIYTKNDFDIFYPSIEIVSKRHAQAVLPDVYTPLSEINDGINHTYCYLKIYGIKNDSIEAVIRSLDHTQYSTVVDISINELNDYDSIRLEYFIVGTYSIPSSSIELYQNTLIFNVVKGSSNKKPITFTEAVNRVLELSEPLRGSEAPKYKFDGVEYVDGISTGIYAQGTQAGKYSTVNISEITLTQCTLREQLQIIGSLLHLEPYLDGTTVKFKEIRKLSQSYLNGKNYVYNEKSIDINNYHTELKSFAENVVNTSSNNGGVIYDYSKDLYKSVRPVTEYARITENNAVAKTSNRIYSIVKVMCGLSGFMPLTDITPYVFEEKVYKSNLSSFAGSYPLSKEWAIYYSINGNTIEGLFFKAPDPVNAAVFSEFSIVNILTVAQSNITKTEIKDFIIKNPDKINFQIEYIPISSSMISHGKQKYNSEYERFTTIFNQSENLIESQYFGENIKGNAARLGNIDETRTYYIDSIDNLPTTGETIDGKIISEVQTEITPFDIKSTVILNDDYIKISEYIGVNSIKRLYEISEREVYNREILIKENVVIGSFINDSYFGKRMLKEEKQLLFMFAEIIASGNKVYFDDKYKLTLSRIRTYSKNKSILYDNLLPCISKSMGNCILFSFNLKDNFSAGESTEIYESEGSFTGRWSIDSKYTDTSGGAYWANIDFYSKIDTSRVEEYINQSQFKLPENIISKFEGEIAFGDFESISTGRNPINLQKDNREQISITYELEFKTNQNDIIIGSALAKYNSLCYDKSILDENGNIVRPHIYLHKFSNMVDKFTETITTTNTAGFYDIGEATFIYDTSFERYKIFAPFGNYTSIAFFGWTIAYPQYNNYYIISDENGEFKRYNEQKGGDVLISRVLETPLLDTDASSREVAFNNLYINITKG